MGIEELIKQHKFTDQVERAMINLLYTSNWMRDQQMEFFKNYNILPQHYNALRIIKGKHPNPVSPSEIKEVLLDKSTDTTRLIDKLVRIGVVNRELCASNRRKMDITLSKKGLIFLDEINKHVFAFQDQLREKLSQEEAAQLSLLLDKLKD